MSQLSQVLADAVLYEGIDKTIAVYAGRFQPFHRGHYSVYELLVKRFGKGNVYIGTSNKVEAGRSPFSFNEKQQIISKMFGIPKNKIVQVKSPFSPKEILNKFDEEKTAFVTAFSEKDTGRLGGKYYKKLTKSTLLKGYGEQGYYIVAPVFKMNIGGQNISGTQIRNVLGSDIDEEKKKEMFVKLYGKMDKKIYDLVTGKLQESYFTITNHDVIDFIESNDIRTLLKEFTGTTGVGEVDDGPGSFLRPEAFESVTEERAEQIGYVVVDYIMGDGKKLKTEIEYPIYPHGPVDAVSYFPAGDYGVLTAMNQVDIYGSEAWDMWMTHISRTASMVGYEIVRTKKQKESQADDKKQAGDDAKASKELIDRDKLTENILDEYVKELISEGGAYGHMAHPFENMQLTFADMKDMISAVLSGDIGVAQEKLDGQNLMITFHDGKIKSARTKTQMRGFGVNALDIQAIKSKFAGRGEVEKAFVFAMQDLESGIGSLSSKQQEKIFGNGRRYMNLEILYPGTTNTIPYGLNMITFHGIVEVDEDGNAIGENKDSARMLGGMLKQINADIQKTFTLVSNPTIKWPKIPDFDSQKKKLNSKVNKLKREFKLRDSVQVIEYHKAWWSKRIDQEAKKRKYTLSSTVKEGLLRRWALGDKKSFTVPNMKKFIDTPKFLEWALKFDKEEHKDVFDSNIAKFESIFLELGAVLLRNISGVLAVRDEEGAVKSIRNKIKQTISQLEASDDIEKMAKVKQQLAKLDQIGGVEGVIPSEGIVFMYKGKVYKLTGTFTPVHHIVKYLTFS